MPRAGERGTYCPDGVKIAEFPAGKPQNAVVIEPWQCEKPWCTPAVFERVRAEVEAELAEAESHAWGCNRNPGHEEPCDGDRASLTY